MRFTILFLLYSITNPVFSGGFRYPNFSYAYAQLHLFNVDPSASERFDYSVYRDGVYAKSKIGNGIRLSKETLDIIHSIYNKGINELRYGLSKCFIPRHGILYYNTKGEVVGSSSICFECEQIYLWSTNPLPDISDDFEHFNNTKAEKQLEAIKMVLKRNDVPIFDDEKDYKFYRDSSSDYKMLGEMFIEDGNLDSLYLEVFSTTDINRWIIDAEKYRLTAEIDTFKFLKNKDGSFFKFDEKKDERLISARILTPFIALPNGIKVGMSLDEILSKIGVYDGLSYPNQITIYDKKLSITYDFEFRTLIGISLTIKTD